MLNKLVLLGLPILEYIVLRPWIRNRLGVHVGWFSMTDYEFYLPSLVAFFLLFWCLEQDRRLALQIRPKGLFLHGVCLLAFCFYNLYLNSIGVTEVSGMSYLVWWVLALASFSTTLSVLVDGSFFFANRFRWVFFPVLFIALSFPIYMEVLEPAWGLVHPLVIGPSCSVLSFTLGPDFRCALWSPNASLLHPKLKLILGSGCSGLEGIVFALTSFTIFFLIRRPLFSPLQWIILAVIDVFLIYCVNVLRIAGIFGSGIFFGSPTLAVQLFHWHAGWIGYSAVQVLYFYLLTRFDSSVVGTGLFRRTRAGTLLVFLALCVSGIASGQSCTFEPCNTRADCDAGCACEDACDCFPCANMFTETNCTDPFMGNDEVCEWVGGACQQISTVAETPDALRGLFWGLSCLIPLSMAFVTARRNVGQSRAV